MPDPEYWIKKLQLEQHPEGGYFKECYRSGTEILKDGLPSRYSGNRDAVTSIYFLLKENDVSKFHRLKSDEIWHFYTGSPVTIHIIHPEGTYQKITLGPQIDQNMSFQYAIEPNRWFGATVDDPSSFSLVGCTVAPGFNFNEFELAEQNSLLREFPEHEAIIRKLT